MSSGFSARSAPLAPYDESDGIATDMLAGSVAGGGGGGGGGRARRSEKRSAEDAEIDLGAAEFADVEESAAKRSKSDVVGFDGSDPKHTRSVTAVDDKVLLFSDVHEFPSKSPQGVTEVKDDDGKKVCDMVYWKSTKNSVITLPDVFFPYPPNGPRLMKDTGKMSKPSLKVKIIDEAQKEFFRETLPQMIAERLFADRTKFFKDKTLEKLTDVKAIRDRIKDFLDDDDCLSCQLKEGGKIPIGLQTHYFHHVINEETKKVFIGSHGSGEEGRISISKEAFTYESRGGISFEIGASQLKGKDGIHNTVVIRDATVCDTPESFKKKRAGAGNGAIFHGKVEGELVESVDAVL